MPRRPRTNSFSLLELLVVVLIMAALIAGVVFFVANYVTWAKNTSDKQTYTILNDALTRWKTEGGNVGALTVGTPVGEVLQYMLTPITLAGNESHICLRPGSTYPARSIVGAGNYAQYHFAQYNTYSDGTATSTVNPYPYGLGVGYLANDGSSDYYFYVQSSTGFIAVKDSAGNITVQDGNENGDFAAGSNASITFWSCVGPLGPDNGTNSAHSGTISQVYAFSGLVGGQGSTILTSVNVSGLTDLNYLDVAGNPAITGSAGSLNALYNSLPTVTNGTLGVNDDGLAATGSNILLAAARGWSCDAPPPNIPQPSNFPAYPGTGGLTIGNGGAQGYSLQVQTTTNYLAYKAGGGTPVLLTTGYLTIPNCNSATIWSVDVNGNPSGAITQISCPSNALTSLNVSGCSGLQSLNCDYNPLTSLNLGGCSSLQTLSCQYSHSLTPFDFSGCPSLQTANITCNNATSLTVNGCPALQSLALDLCYSLNSLAVTNCPSLTTLSCRYGCGMTSLNVSGDTALQTINADHNQLATLSFTGLTSLQGLYFYNNSLTSVNASNLPNLQHLNCSNNQSGCAINVTNDAALWDFNYDSGAVITGR
jgi:type II secretory pathway pseudopilin PulG